MFVGAAMKASAVELCKDHQRRASDGGQRAVDVVAGRNEHGPNGTARVERDRIGHPA